MLWCSSHVLFSRLCHTTTPGVWCRDKLSTHFFLTFFLLHLFSDPPFTSANIYCASHLSWKLLFSNSTFRLAIFGERDGWKLSQVVCDTDCEARVRGTVIDVPTHGQCIVGSVIHPWPAHSSANEKQTIPSAIGLELSRASSRRVHWPSGILNTYFLQYKTRGPH